MRDLLRSLLATSGAQEPIDAASTALTALFANAPVGMALFTRELAAAAVNPAFAALVDAPPGAPLDRLAMAAFAGGGELAALAAEVRDTGIARSCERWGHLLVHCFPIGRPGDVTGVGCIVERDHAAARVEDGLLDAVSHDLRAPLATMLVWNTALHDNPSNPAIRARAHEAIRQSVLDQTRLIDNLIDLASARRGALHLDRAPVAVHDELTAAIERARPAANTKGVVLELRCDPDAGAIEGDHDRLQQLLAQLLSNAIKVTEPGGRVIVAARRLANLVELAVTDAGVELRRERGPSVFEPFLPGEGPADRFELGMGFAVARAIARAHGGTLRAEANREGRGATFVVTLAHARRAGGVRPAAPGAPSLRGLRVLIVDDDRDTLEALAILLGAAGAIVETEPSAAGAWDRIQRSVPDVLISDLGIPDDEGQRLIRRVRASAATRGVYAVAFTGRAAPAERERALAAGFDRHVTKPVEIDELVAVLARVRPA